MIQIEVTQGRIINAKTSSNILCTPSHYDDGNIIASFLLKQILEYNTNPSVTSIIRFVVNDYQIHETSIAD